MAEFSANAESRNVREHGALKRRTKMNQARAEDEQRILQEDAARHEARLLKEHTATQSKRAMKEAVSDTQ